MGTTVDPSTSDDAGPRPGLTLALALGCPAFVLVAVGLEVSAGQYANSETPAWAGVFPLSWPQPARVAFWLAVAAAAAGFRIGLTRLGMRARPLGTILTVAPFLLFALGIATGSSFTTWH